ncbi:DNA independent RNA polymerase I transcription factor [Teratosphaeriaceae sp. CCFEE 6253]|nr:DNA independent RNA polymerase I transcription factor [Teratosphaeriaceae sp. CCFEE 6253]
MVMLMRQGEASTRGDEETGERSDSAGEVTRKMIVRGQLHPGADAAKCESRMKGGVAGRDAGERLTHAAPRADQRQAPSLAWYRALTLKVFAESISSFASDPAACLPTVRLLRTAPPHTPHASRQPVEMVSLASPAGRMLPPPTPLHTRPALGLKRDSAHLDTDDEAGLSSATKRLKVAFSPKVDVRILDDWNEKSFELVKEEVRLGIEQHLAPGGRRNDAHYVKLLQLLGQHVGSEEAASSALLKKYLLAINSRVSSLGKCGKLAVAVLELPWLGRDDVYASLYVRFLMGLATAHSKYIPSIMEKLVSSFARLPASLGRLPGEAPVSRTTMFRRVHGAIKSILRQVPSATASLTRVLKSEFPDDLATTRSYLQYQRHLLRLADCLPEIKAEVLAVLTQRLVGVDVQVQLDLDDLEEEAEDSLLLQQRPRSRNEPTGLGDSDESDDDSKSESEETIADGEQRMKELRLKVAKMDGTMDLLFAYYTPLIQGQSEAEPNDAYHQLLAHFESFILPNRTRHAQFLVFHFSQTRPEHAHLFARQCLHAIFETGRSLSLRLHACAYLASFVARGARLPTSLVREIFAGLCDELERLRQRHEPACAGPDKRAYAVYYALAQALLYIFCFRWRDLHTGAAASPSSPSFLSLSSAAADDDTTSADDLLAEGRELAWLPRTRELLSRSLHSRLNPLKVCAPAITAEFAALAHHVRFVYVFSLLEANKRVRLGIAPTTTGGARGVVASETGRRETAMDWKRGEAHLQLEAYFPFDPYALPRSKGWVEGEYNEWRLPPGMAREEDDDGGEGEEGGDGEDGSGSESENGSDSDEEEEDRWLEDGGEELNDEDGLSGRR